MFAFFILLLSSAGHASFSRQRPRSLSLFTGPFIVIFGKHAGVHDSNIMMKCINSYTGSRTLIFSTKSYDVNNILMYESLSFIIYHITINFYRVSSPPVAICVHNNYPRRYGFHFWFHYHLLYPSTT